jgi:hypothetical protein
LRTSSSATSSSEAVGSGRDVVIGAFSRRLLASGKPTEVALTLLPFAVLLIHASVLGRWIVDDAGISFAYARNLAHGSGLVSQPGVEPVEGYSNFLWVLLFVPFFKLNLFHPVWLPKILGLASAAGAMVLLRAAIRPDVGSLGSAVTTTLVALQPPFVVWSVSGLENPLYALIIAGLLLVCIRVSADAVCGRTSAAVAALLAFAAAVVRPDGVLYAVAFPCAVLYTVITARPRRDRTLLRPLLTYTSLFTVAYIGLLAFRWWYFHDLLPNTYYAKGGPDISSIRELILLRPATFEKILQLVASVTGASLAGLTLVALIVGIACLAALRVAPGRSGFPLILFVAIGVSIYVVLPPDYMGEYRFATPPLLLLPALLTTSLFRVSKVSLSPSRRRIIVAIGLALLLLASGRQAMVRTPAFAANPAVPFARVAQHYAYRFNHYADLLGLANASLLAPDLGATLYYSRLRVFDLGMLCDRIIARTLGKDQQRFYQYVFETARPTFITTHGYWSWLAKLDQDERFKRDYVQLVETQEVVFGTTVTAGDYVRKDVVIGRETTIDLIRRELAD